VALKSENLPMGWKVAVYTYPWSIVNTTSMVQTNIFEYIFLNVPVALFVNDAAAVQLSLVQPSHVQQFPKFSGWNKILYSINKHRGKKILIVRTTWNRWSEYKLSTYRTCRNVFKGFFKESFMFLHLEYKCSTVINFTAL
jgi:hypothetical protein